MWSSNGDGERAETISITYYCYRLPLDHTLRNPPALPQVRLLLFSALDVLPWHSSTPIGKCSSHAAPYTDLLFRVPEPS